MLILFFIIIIYFYIIEPRFLNTKLKNENQHGSARFATFQEIKTNFDKEDLNNIKNVGVPIFFNKSLNKIWFDKITPHYVYLGSTGSGKSATAVIPLCTFIANSQNKRSVFITDPKGEIFSTTSKMFQDNGYKVLTLDFRKPTFSNKINILEPIINEYENYIKYEKLQIKEDNKSKILKYSNESNLCMAEANRLIKSLSNMLVKDNSEQKDPFWNNSARSLIEGIISLFLEEYKNNKINRNQITMTSIRKFQNSILKDDNLELLKKYLNSKDYGTKSKDNLTPVLNSSESTIKSIFAVAGEKLSIFDDINVANIMSSSNFDFDVLGKYPTVIYLIVPDEDKTYYSLITIIVGMMYKILVKSANNNEEKRNKYGIEWILDEFANCPPLLDIEAIVSVARSRNMRFHFFIQSFSQLNNVYGKEVSQIILDNCGLVYLKTNTEETAEIISKRLGEHTIISNSISHSVSINNFNGNKTTSLIARKLMTPDEIKQLHYKTIIFPIIGYPIFRDTIIYTKFKCYKKGYINRSENVLCELKDTYFTVENLKVSENNLINKNDVNNKIFNEQIENDKRLLVEGINKLRKILNCPTKRVVYNIVNNRTYACIKVNNIKVEKNKDYLLIELSNNYHLEFKEDKDNLTLIELHLKNNLIS